MNFCVIGLPLMEHDDAAILLFCGLVAVISLVFLFVFRGRGVFDVVVVVVPCFCSCVFFFPVKSPTRCIPCSV